MASIVYRLKWLPAAARRRVLYLVWLLLWSHSLVALSAEENRLLFQAGFFSQEWTVDEGLPHNIINQIVQDPEGYLWIASIRGLVRFDGHQFKEAPLANPSGSHNYSIRSLAVEPAGNLLMVPASGGLLRFQNGASAAHPASDALAGKTLFVLFVESDGVTWISTEGELMRWENGASQSFYRGREIPASGGRYTFAKDAQGRLWIGTGEYFGYYDDGKLIWRPDRMGPNIIIAPSHSGGIWKGAAEFCLDYLVDDGSGHLVTSPSTSPETRFGVTDRGIPYAVSHGSTMDLAFIRQLFEHLIEASSILNLDASFRFTLLSTLPNLLPFQISPSGSAKGELQEWSQNYSRLPEGGANNRYTPHRHASHLVAVWPLSQITARGTPALFAAAKRALINRAEGGFYLDKGAMFARLHDGDRALNSNDTMPTGLGAIQNRYPPKYAAFAELLLQSIPMRSSCCLPCPPPGRAARSVASEHEATMSSALNGTRAG